MIISKDEIIKKLKNKKVVFTKNQIDWWYNAINNTFTEEEPNPCFKTLNDLDKQLCFYDQIRTKYPFLCVSYLEN
jgi:hypothetical protein